MTANATAAIETIQSGIVRTVVVAIQPTEMLSATTPITSQRKLVCPSVPHGVSAAQVACTLPVHSHPTSSVSVAAVATPYTMLIQRRANGRMASTIATVRIMSEAATTVSLKADPPVPPPVSVALPRATAQARPAPATPVAAMKSDRSSRPPVARWTAKLAARIAPRALPAAAPTKAGKPVVREPRTFEDTTLASATSREPLGEENSSSTTLLVPPADPIAST